MSKIKTFIAASAMTGALMLASVEPALAHATYYRLGSLGEGGVFGHTYVHACDDKADGKGVRTIYQLRSGFVGLVGDGNGSASGCGARTVTNTSNPVVFYQVCAGANGVNELCGPRLSA